MDLIFELLCWFILEILWHAVTAGRALLSYRERRVVWHTLAGAALGAAVTVVHPAPLMQTPWVRTSGLVGGLPAVGVTLAEGRRTRGDEQGRRSWVRYDRELWIGVN